MNESQEPEKEHWSSGWFCPKGPVTKEVAVACVLRVYVVVGCVLGFLAHISAPGTWQRAVYIANLVLITIAFLYGGHWYVRHVVLPKVRDALRNGARSLLLAAIARLDAFHQAREARVRE